MAKPLPRRAVLTRGFLAGAGAAMLGGCTESPSPLDPTDWKSVRAQFDLDPKLAHFAAFVLAAHPASVRVAIDAHRHALDRDTEAYLHEDDREEPVRKEAARYLGASVDEVALTDSTTMGLGLLYGGLRLTQGQDILTTEHDFYATHESLRLTAERWGVPVRRVRLYDNPANASADQIVSRLRAGVQPRTRVVAVTWVHSSTGVKLPIRAIADMLSELNKSRDEADRALLCVDGVHGFGAEDATVEQLGCDFLVSGAHKWLFGPRGTGVVWGRTQAWTAVRPIIPSFSTPGFAGWLSNAAPAGPAGELATPGGYHSFENRWALAEAFRFHQKIGRARITARIKEQATRLKDGLAGLKNAQLVTPKDPALSAGIVCCVIAGTRSGAVVDQLRSGHAIVASVTPYRDAYVRFGPSMVTTPEQVDQLVKAMSAL